MAYLIQEKDLSPELRQKLILSEHNDKILEEIKKISSNHQLTEDSEVLKNFFNLEKQKISTENLDAELKNFINDTKEIQKNFSRGLTAENFGGQFKTDWKNLQDKISVLTEQVENFQSTLNQLQIFFDTVNQKNNEIQSSVQERNSASEQKIENTVDELKSFVNASTQDLQMELNSSADKILNLENKIEVVENKIKRSPFNGIYPIPEENKIKKNQLEKTLEENINKITPLEKSVADNTGKISSLEKDFENNADIILSLEQELAELTIKVADNEKTLAELISDRENDEIIPEDTETEENNGVTEVQKQ